jgi:starch synthase
MKILFAAAEIAPLTKVGGLADVVRSLPIELIKRGHDVRVIVPKYGFVDYSQHKKTQVIDSLVVLSQHEFRNTSVEQMAVDGVPVYLVSSPIFSGSNSVYGGNEVEKFWAFCECVSEIIPRLGWKPSILHCHDWHTGLLPMLARRNRDSYGTVLTIHNIRYQGYFDENILYRSHLGQCWDAGIPGITHIPWNLMVQGILWADVINAVSETFAREILTPEQGYDMQDFLKFRQEALSGIVNGLGYEEYDPSNDGLIAAPYEAGNTANKLLNRREVLATAGWGYDEDVPLIGMVSRLDEQKGLDIILDAVPLILNSSDARFVFLGRGNEYYEDALRRLEMRFPHRVKAFTTFDNTRAHLIYAGSDMFLMPSKWEPCGLGQLIAMRYGTIPIVRCTGGLADTVRDMSAELRSGTGFVFNGYSGASLVAAIERGIKAFKQKAAWKRVIERIMKQDFGWSEPAAKYEQLYIRAMGFKEDESL